MKYFFSNLYVFNSVSAIVLMVLSILFTKKKGRKEYLTYCVTISSAVWSMGFGVVALQTDAEVAHFWKSFAILGTVFFMITSQRLLGEIAGRSRKSLFISQIVAFTGIPIYILSIQREQTIYYMSRFGMSYTFKPGLINNLYTGYFSVVSLDILLTIVYMIKHSQSKKVKTFGRHFLVVTILVLIGTVLDMVFPAVGLPAMPGSNVTQFWGLLLIYHAMAIMSRSEINTRNLAEYIYKSAAAPFIVFDEKHCLKIANSSALDFIGISEVDYESANTRIDELFDIIIQDEFLNCDDYLSLDCATRNSGIPCNLNINTIYDRYDDPLGYLVTVKDLTKRMQYIEELQQARDEADSSNKAKSRFLANMSHEIRTPMNAIIGFSDIILSQEPKKEEVLEYVMQIRDSSRGLLAIINDILDISKIESGKMEIVSGEYRLSNVLRGCISQIKPLADVKKLQFDVDIDETLPSVLYGDSVRINEILINLLNNAVKYTDSGNIKLQVSSVKVENDDSEKQIYLQFKISDSGRGISKENQEKIFDAFEQVSKKLNDAIEGTGLGLAIVKGYLELMNGQISVDSILGEGSTFTVLVPQRVIDDSPIGTIGNNHEVLNEKPQQIKFKDTRLLVVDDNHVNRMVALRLLELYGIEADTASDGAEAIELCKKNQYPIVFMDQMMPGMDGIEAMKHIRELDEYYSENGEGKIIVLTADAIKGVREQLLNAGFDEYIEKPIDVTVLKSALIKFIPGDRLIIGE